MSEEYIRSHFAKIKVYGNIIENRLNDEWCTMESVLEDNTGLLNLAQKYKVNYIFIQAFKISMKSTLSCNCKFPLKSL